MRIPKFLGSFLLCALVSPVWSDTKLEEHPFLQPYVAQLKQATPSSDLERVKRLAESDLPILHFGYGTWIRNKWLWGDRDPALAQFFFAHGIQHPDDMSAVLIRALWIDLNRNLTAEERTEIDARRALVSAKHASYKKLRDECAAQLAASKAEFEKCYAAHGLPSKNPLNQNPFYNLVVHKSGAIDRIVLYTGASPGVGDCIRREVERYRFSSFEYDEKLTLYIVKFPDCAVEESFRVY